ncbi:ArnT family glycosyltransferase [Daejeonella oryzae]|uniref:ArnT family glycosyltransferase n=1 Tax=Daejeonella oryzae TaxID=1122943 RepID=UPI000415B4EA|nr:hypothetical protein [Daejeonella oryzae]
MQKLENYIQKNPRQTFSILIIMALAPFLINLGILPLFADEPTRAIVAMEMILSKNFSIPTIGGEFYYNKPPLYNWILALFYLVSGSYSEFVTRLPAVIPMFLFAVTIYYSVSFFLKDKRIAALSGILFLVNGRMLIYDSMLGHIDIFYSWLTFISFMLIFYFYQRKLWFLLFFSSYIITAVAFLSKGLPSIVFQGFTLIALLAYTKNLKKLFSWQHMLCGAICLILISLYFINYSRQNPNLEGYFSTIWDQSSQRTGAKTGFGKTIIHIIQFPFEHLFHLFPASLLLLFCLHKRFWKKLMVNDFLKYTGIIFLANIWVYWLSPETRPRYLMMLYPLLFIIWAHAYYTYRDSLTKSNKAFKIILLILALVVTLAVPAAFFSGLDKFVPYLTAKILFIFSACLLLCYLIYKFKNEYIIPFIAFLLVVRLAFSWFILPYRLNNQTEIYYKNASIEVGKITKGNSLFFYQYNPNVLEIPFHHRLIFYMESSRKETVKFTSKDRLPGYYFTFDRDLNNPNAVLLKSYQGNLKLFKVK